MTTTKTHVHSPGSFVHSWEINYLMVVTSCVTRDNVHEDNRENINTLRGTGRNWLLAWTGVVPPACHKENQTTPTPHLNVTVNSKSSFNNSYKINGTKLIGVVLGVVSTRCSPVHDEFDSGRQKQGTARPV